MILKNHEDAKLEEVTAYLHGREIGICSLSTRIQAYDFTNQRASKRNSEKNAIPEYEEFINNTVLPSTKSKRVRALSEDRANLRNSTDRKLRALSLDDLHESKDYIIKRLILLLNDLFPDYDFALARPTQFALHSHQTCMQIINSHLAEVTLGDAQFLHKMWNAINDSINLSDCEILAYNPIGMFSNSNIHTLHTKLYHACILL